MPVNDQGDAYKLIYPFGWQEVSVTGQDVVYKVRSVHHKANSAA